jgi:quinol monooxygenase YgiN
MTTVELTRFRVDADKNAGLLAARSAMLKDFRADRHGFLDARLVRLPDNEWLDILTWETPEDLAASREKGPNLPGIASFFSAIAELIMAEEGYLAQDGER